MGGKNNNNNSPLSVHRKFNGQLSFMIVQKSYLIDILSE